MTILYQDPHWLVVEKPSGISTHRAHTGDLGLLEWLDLHHDLSLHICSRLDKGTSGLLLFAKDAAAAAEAEKIHSGERSKKTYFFIAPRSPRSSWTETTPIDSKPCKTVFSKVKEGTVYALYRAVIHRGRTHQIRRHAAAAGIPLLGDSDYGGAAFVRLCLHCTELEWPGIQDRLTAPVPHWFESCLNGISENTAVLAIAEKRYPFLSAVTDCCRLLHRDEYLPDIAIDKYGDFLCVTGFDETLPAETILHTLRETLSLLSKECDCRGGVIKTSLRDPHKNRLFADMICWGKTAPQSFPVRENHLHFTVQLNERQHTGLFLDQRDSRRRIAKIAAGKRVANLFAFTCSFSVHALAAGAEVVFSVDLAAGCLRQGRENVAINQLDGKNNAKFIREDTRKWLARQLRKKKKSPREFVPFDIVICDPPVFASGGRGKSFHVEKEWQALATAVQAILAQGGAALFANNHQAGSEPFYHEILQNCFTQVTRLTPPLDFPRLRGTPRHVSIYWCEK